MAWFSETQRRTCKWWNTIFGCQKLTSLQYFPSFNVPRRQKWLEQGQFFCLRVLFFAELQSHLSFKEARRKFTFAYFVSSQLIVSPFQRVSLYLCIEILVLPKQENPLSNDVIIFIDHDWRGSAGISSHAVTFTRRQSLYQPIFSNTLVPPTTLPASKMSKCALCEGFTRSTCLFYSVRAKSSDWLT